MYIHPFFSSDRIEFIKVDILILKDIRNIIIHYFSNYKDEITESKNKNEILSFLNDLIEILGG